MKMNSDRLFGIVTMVITTILLILFLAGCDDKAIAKPPKEKVVIFNPKVIHAERYIIMGYNFRFMEIEYEECRYIVNSYYDGSTMIHKENCPNSIHREIK